MHILCEKAPLAAALGAAREVAARKTTIPILETLKLDAGDGEVAVTGTDMDLLLATRAAAAVREAGACCLPAGRLADIVKALPDGSQVEISPLGSGSQYRVTAGRSRFVLSALPASDFPAPKEPEWSCRFTLSADAVGRLLGGAETAISTEETRFYLNGIHLHRRDGELIGVATDGHRLGRFGIAAPPGAEGATIEAGIILPAVAARFVRRRSEGDVAVALSDQRIRFAWGGTTVYSRLIEGTFPDYRRVVPEPGEITLDIESADLMAAAARVTLLSDDKGTRALKLTLAGGGAALSCPGSDGESGEEDLSPLAVAGEIAIGFNGRYLADCLSGLGKGRVTIAMANAGSPALLRRPDDDAAFFVIMPLRA